MNRDLIFSAVAAAEPAEREKSYFDRTGKVLVVLDTLLLHESKDPKKVGETLAIASFSVVAADSPAYEEGEEVSIVLPIQASGWRGKFALRELKGLVASIGGISQEEVTPKMVAACFDSFEDELVGTKVVCSVTESEKDGKTYHNRFWSTPR